MRWTIIDTGKRSADENMAIDAALLKDLGSTKQPILHLYDWHGDAATFGHFLDPYKYINREVAERRGLQLARRSTGGGIVFHLHDFPYSILIPASHPSYSLNTLENYAFVHTIVAALLTRFLALSECPVLLEVEPDVPPDAIHFCMAKPTKNDVMWQGKKLAGGAQRRTKHGFLHQGTISLANAPIEPSLFLSHQVQKTLSASSVIPSEIIGKFTPDWKNHLKKMLCEFIEDFG